jgi:hypothetical protein
LFRKKTLHLSSQTWKLFFRLPAVGEVGGEILFGFSFRPLRARDSLVATGVSGAMQHVFWWGFISLSGWNSIAPFCATDFENVKNELFFCLPSAERSGR